MDQTVLYRLSDTALVSNLIELTEPEITLKAWGGTVDEVSQHCANPDQSTLVLFDGAGLEAVEICAGLKSRGINVPTVCVHSKPDDRSEDGAQFSDRINQTVYDCSFVQSEPAEVTRLIREILAKDRRRKQSIPALTEQGINISIGKSLFFKNQAYIEQLLDHAPVGIILTNQQGHVVSINRYGIDVIGANPEKLFNKSLSYIFNNNLDETDGKYNSRGSGPGETKSDTLFLRPDGRWRHLTVQSVGLGHLQEGVERMVLFQDVSDQRAAEKRIRKAQKFEAAAQVTTGMAHHFNNFMQVIMANLEMAINTPNPKDSTNFIQNAVQAVRRGKSMTEHLLSYSQSIILNTERIELTAFISALTSDLDLNHGHQISLQTRYSVNSVFVKVDREMLSLAMTAVIQNAIDAMPSGGDLTITTSKIRRSDMPVTGDQLLDEEIYASVEISDTGHGMAANTIEQAVEPFFTTREVGEGNGLGLSMAYGFALQSRGTLDIESHAGKGTKVRIFLPIDAA